MLTRLRALAMALSLGLWLGVGCSTGEYAPAPPDGEGGAAGEGADQAGSASAARAGKGGKSGGQGGSSGKSGGSGGASGATKGGASLGGGGADSGEDCPGCASGFCLDDGTCVECSPSNDQCPAGQYCTDANACAKGCKDAASCASGSCGADHACERCIGDEECTGDDVCSSGECGPACDEADEGEQANCGAGLTCCALHCSDVKVDSLHCGVCGAACEAGQFCGLSDCQDAGSGGAGPGECVACHDVALANLCSIRKVIVILDTNRNPSEGNRAPGRAVGAALEAQCQPTPTVTEEEQDSVSALNFTTGRPVSGGGELLLVAGGSFYQNLEGYVEQSISPLYVKIDNGKQQFFSRQDATTPIVTDTNEGDIESHDFFALQFMRDAASGSLVLNLQGFWLSGTEAAAFFVIHAVLPDPAQFDQAWYVYEWTDADGDKKPALEEIEQRAYGR